MKPVELIVTIRLHDLVDEIARAPKIVQDAIVGDNADDLMRQLARSMLCRVSHDAALPVVLKALAAVGAPATIDELTQRLAAAREARAREQGETSPTPESKPQGATS